MPSDVLIERIFPFLLHASGIDFGSYKIPTLRRAIHRRMALLGMRSADKYLRYLKTHREEAKALSQASLIKVTGFFRDPGLYRFLRRKVFPELARRGRKGPIRIWVAGCCTGEEAYSLAIALTDYLKENRLSRQLHLFGSDLSEEALAKARSGIYSLKELKGVPNDCLDAHFIRTADGKFEIDKNIRALCSFARHDLLSDPPFSKVDLVSCRNLLMYLQAASQESVLDTFRFALNEGSFLVLGKSENIGAFQPTRFRLLDKTYCVYSKLPEAFEAETVPVQSLPQARRKPAAPEQLLRELEELRVETQSMKEEQEATIQELRSANEEVLSGNEELQSLNEELESAKEELQSMNEELVTANEQLTSQNEALRQSEEKFRLLVQEVKEYAIFLMDPHGKIMTWNAGAERIKGYKAEEVIGSHFSRFYPPEDKASTAHKLRQALKEGVYKEEGWRVRKDGSRFWAGVVITPLRDSAGKHRGFAKVTRDMTERRNADERLRRAYEELEDRVKERTADLQEALKEKETLLKEIHHRVKNNMQVISSLLNLQSMHPEISRDPQIKALFEDSQARIRSMALVHEKLYGNSDLARVEMGPYIRTLVHELVQSHAAARVGIDLEADEVSMDLDTAVPCGLLLNELVVNALKHAFPDARKGRIRIRLLQERNQYLLEVSDNGVGLPPDIQLNGSRSLGLGLVQALIRQLQGKVEIDRETGTAFRIRFSKMPKRSGRIEGIYRNMLVEIKS